MRNILSILALSIFDLGCGGDSSVTPSDPIVGLYKVEYYISDGDTLLSSSGINSLHYSDFNIEVSNRTEDKITLAFLTIQNGQKCRIASPNISLKKENDLYKLSIFNDSLNSDYGYIKHNTLFIKATSWDYTVPPPYKLRETITTAKKISE